MSNDDLPKIDIEIVSTPIKASKRKLKGKVSNEPISGKLNNKPEDFMVYHHAIPKSEPTQCWTTIDVLQDLYGLKWNEVTMCYVLSLRPSAVRVSDGAVTADSYSNRITVFINNKKEKLINRICMEVSMPSPNGMCGWDMSNYVESMRKGKEDTFKSIDDMRKDNGGNPIEIAPGMWIGGMEDVSFYSDNIPKIGD